MRGAKTLLAKKKQEQGVKVDSDLSAAALKALVSEFKAEIKNRLGLDFPEDPYVQLAGALGLATMRCAYEPANERRRQRSRTK